MQFEKLVEMMKGRKDLFYCLEERLLGYKDFIVSEEINGLDVVEDYKGGQNLFEAVSAEEAYTIITKSSPNKK
ncbi:MAG TPA: hypothetical protein VK190_05010 [Pseudoneobacillus sp.]|nr:hypothetical protein [Pseudoneobacillus sp.]